MKSVRWDEEEDEDEFGISGLDAKHKARIYAQNQKQFLSPGIDSFRLLGLQFKLCKVRSVQFGHNGIPYLNTYDGRTIRYPDPLIKANYTIKYDLESNKIVDFIKFDVGNVVMVTGGRNRGRVGIIKNKEKHKGSFEIIHIQDATGREFATRVDYVFTLGKGTKSWVTLPKGKGIKLSIIEEARKRRAMQAANAV
ncbi:hypothetical protein L6452_14494 [Arctium lappa]|uniref:Uncharacterized protein n=1 Tax=Arctium lappa TaxID=4217 RepID=A0ACB9CL58_ARCLA|nr:hypothetical protein L6452_14494 [Arctium lappa]